MAALRFESGALGTIAATTGAYPGVAARIELFGDRGSAIIENDRLAYLRLARDESQEAGSYGTASGPLEREETESAAADPAAVAADTHGLQIADAIRAIREGGTPLVDGEQGRQPVEVILAIYESARTGQEVRRARKRRGGRDPAGAFADEISPDLDEQIDVLRSEGIGDVELRSVWGINVLSLNDEQLGTVERGLRDAGLAVAAIGSPIGKPPIDRAAGEVERLARAIELAHRFGAGLIRVFSYYGPSSGAGSAAEQRETVISSLSALTEQGRAAGVVLVHENEKEIYGDSIERCADLLDAIDSPFFRAAFDPANFIQVGDRPFPDAFQALAPWIAHVHVKDATPEGREVPVGEGAAGWRDILDALRGSGYDGFLSIEPHLAQAGPLGGFSGPERFRLASRAIQRLLRDIGWEHA